MSVNAAANVSTAVHAAPIQRKAESAEVNVGGDHDGDSDDRGAVRPTVNAGGQKLGQIVNVKA